MFQLLFRSFLLTAVLICLGIPLRAGATIDADPADGTASSTAVNDSNYYGVYTNVLGVLPGYDSDSIVDAFPLPYLAPNQQVTAASISYYLAGEYLQGQISYNIQLYGLNRVSVPTAVPLSNPAPLISDWYDGPNDTANTLLDPTFIPPGAALNQNYTYSGSNLAAFIQKQYANSAFNGLDLSNSRYVYFRLSIDNLEKQGINYYMIGSARNPTRSFHPQLSLTISGGITNDAGRLQFSFNLPENATTSAGV